MKYTSPDMEITEVELHALMNPSITKADGDAGIGMGDPNDPTLPIPGVPGTAQGRRYDIWADPEEEEEENF